MLSNSTRGTVVVLTGWLAMTGAAFAYVTDSSPRSDPDYNTFQPPAKGQTWNDPVFGTPIKRLSNAMGTSDDASGGMLTWILNEYSTMSAWNSDNSRLLLQHGSYFALYDGSGTFIRNLPFEIHAGAEPRWSRANNNTLYYVRGNSLKRYDVASGAMTMQRTFSEYGSISGKASRTSASTAAASFSPATTARSSSTPSRPTPRVRCSTPAAAPSTASTSRPTTT